MSISKRVQKGISQTSWIRRIFDEGAALRKQHSEGSIFDLSLGNPVAPPPPEFDRELRRLAESPVEGMHRYMENAGYAETRAAVACELARETGVDFSADNIVMTCGAAGALNVALRTIVNPGDEVIIFAPYFAEYTHYIENHDGIPRILPTDDDFIPRLDALDRAISSKTKAVIINSPNNPTGAVYSEDFLSKLGKLLEARASDHGTEIYLISDEAYRRIVFDGLKAPPIWCHYRNSLMVTSHSKDLSLPGERIGYIALNPEASQGGEIIAGLIFCNRTLGFVNAPALMQRAVTRLQGITVPVAEYQEKRDFLYKNLTGMGYSVKKPQGAFYLFPHTPTQDDVAFVQALRDFGVLVVPGRGFGLPGYFRIAYCVDKGILQGSLDGFRKAARKFNL